MKFSKRTIKGELYYGPVIFKILEMDELGRPSKVIIGYEDTVFHLKENDNFFTGYISSAVLDMLYKVKA
jgi:hypothetical protein